MTQIAFVAYPGVTALDVVGPYEVLRNLPHAQVRFVWLRGRRATSHWLTLPALKAFGAIPVADERIVHQDNIVTSAGVSAGLDLALWLAGQLGGEARAKAIQLAIEYDPQPPFDSGHMSKASPTTKAAATALLSKDSAKPANLTAATLLAWGQLRSCRPRRLGRWLLCSRDGASGSPLARRHVARRLPRRG